MPIPAASTTPFLKGYTTRQIPELPVCNMETDAPLIDPNKLHEVALAAIKHRTAILEHMPGLRGNPHFMKSALENTKTKAVAVKIFGYVASPALLDHDFMIWVYGWLLYRSEEFELVRNALKNMPPELRRDKDFLWKLLQGWQYEPECYLQENVFEVMDASLRGDREWIVKLVKNEYESVVAYFDPSLYRDRKFVEYVLHLMPELKQRVEDAKYFAAYDLSHIRLIDMLPAASDRWDPMLHATIGKFRFMYERLLTTRLRRVSKRWSRAVLAVRFILRMARDAVYTAKQRCEEDLAKAMLVGNETSAHVLDVSKMNGMPPTGILRMVWEMGRASAGVKRPRTARE